MLHRAAALVAVVALALPASALASNRISDVNVKSPTLKVDARGRALVSYVREDGTPRHVIVWGALNSNVPSQTVRQVRFSFDYGGGWGLFHNASWWKTFNNACLPYDGPALVYLVAACKAPDGTYWALQTWQRNLPLLGFRPWLPSQNAWELHVSHWSGPLGELDVYAHRTYGGQFDGLFGRLTYNGAPVYGFGANSSGNPFDSYGRNVYIDTLDSWYGSGWWRESGILVHNPTGTFCHSFVPQKPFPGYPSLDTRAPAPGSSYRVTVIGPGVTPDLQWQGDAPPRGDATFDVQMQSKFDELMTGDRRCAPER